MAQDPGIAQPTIVRLTPDVLERVSIAPRVIPPVDPAAAHRLLTRAVAARDVGSDSVAVAVAAIAGDTIVGLALAAPTAGGDQAELLAVGVAPGNRRRGLATALVQALSGAVEGPCVATVTVAERDPIEPLDFVLRASIARRVLERAGFRIAPVDSAIARIDPGAVRAERP